MSCRCRTIGAYATWQVLWAERHEGIVFAACPNKRTGPMEKLERDLAEGRQKSEVPKVVPWRHIQAWNAIRDRKIIIYGALKAQHDGKDYKAYMNALQHDVQAALNTAASRLGNITTLMTSIKAKLEAAPGFLTPIEFEKQILSSLDLQRDSIMTLHCKRQHNCKLDCEQAIITINISQLHILLTFIPNIQQMLTLAEDCALLMVWLREN